MGVTTYYDSTLDIMLEIPEYMAFKDGDIVVGNYGPFIYNGRIHKGCNYFGAYCGFLFNCDFVINEESNDTWASKIERKSTEEETQKLIDALKKSKNPRAKEYLKRFFGIDAKEQQESEGKPQEDKPKHEFKPFDKVLVRDKGEVWICSLFSHINNKQKKYHYVTISGDFEQCLPYEGNEHLLGTTDNLE